MAKLARRYNKYELETLLACIKPYERWTPSERVSWAKDQTGFRHFAAANVTAIELYKPKPSSATAHSGNPNWKPAA